MGRPKKYLTEEERKAAKKEYQKKYYQDNKEKFAGYFSKWRKNNKEKFSAYQAKYYKSHQEKFNEYFAGWIADKRATKKGRAQMHVDNYIRIDKMYNRGECTLTADWIIQNIFNQPCHYCGETDWHELGCDRIDNALPHTPDNVVPCCSKCNTKRGSRTYDEFMRMIGKIA